MKPTMTGTTAKAYLLDLLLEPLRGCKGLYNYRQDLMQKILSMTDLNVRERIKHLEQSHHPGTQSKHQRIRSQTTRPPIPTPLKN